MSYRNGYMLAGQLASRGYDWWWHSLVGISKETGEKRAFFLEYFVINPGLGGKQPILGQLTSNKVQKIRPSYAMLKAGSWGDNGAVINNFYGISDLSACTDKMDVRIGPNLATDTHLQGSVELTESQSQEHPEYLSDAGHISWDLKAEKVLSYDVGYGASKPVRKLNAFQMYWHLQGMQAQYSGIIIFNGEEFEVTPNTSYGYQDKNWGSDFTNPWIWLNCNNLTSQTTGVVAPKTSLVVGGDQPVLFGLSLPRRLLVAFYHEGRLYDFNWSKFWLCPGQQFYCVEETDVIVWKIKAWIHSALIDLSFTCPKDKMLLIKYENPDGELRHKRLWNGGHAFGVAKLYRRVQRRLELIDSFDGEFGGCEYGIYAKESRIEPN